MNLIPKIQLARDQQLYAIRNCPIYIPDDSVFAGLVKDDEWEKTVPPPMADNKHYPMGIEWKRGFKGVSDKARQTIEKGALSPDEIETLRGVIDVYEEMITFTKRHIEAIDPLDKSKAKMRENLLAIAEGPPRTLAQALQLYYLLWRIRSIRIHPYVSTATLGRFDQHFYEFYEHDIKSGELTKESALSLIEDFWRKLNQVNSGDTLMTVTLSGTDVNGQDVTNELSYIMLEASYNVALTEPHITVRLHKNTPRPFLELAYKRLMLGHGQPTFYFDEMVIPELTSAGVPLEYAINFASNGCSEIILDGCGKILFLCVEAVKTLELTMYNGNETKLPGDPIGYYWTFHCELEYDVPESVIGYRTGDPILFDKYEEMEAAYIKQYNFQLKKQLDVLTAYRRDEMERGVSHPILNGSLTNTLEKGLDMFRGGLPPYGLTMFSGSLPTAADCLAALKKVVFEDKQYTMMEILSAMRQNFEGCEEIRAALLSAPKFGNDDDYVDLIAKRLAENFLEQVTSYSKECGILIHPTLIGYLFMKEARITGATPDGRKWKDPIAEHFCPTPGRAVCGPTAVLKSVSKTKLKKAFGCGDIQISLPPFNDYEKGLAVVDTLVNYAKTHDFNMLNIAIYDIERFRAAQRDPENNADVIVRVFGYNARFIDCSQQLQEHIIARILS